MNSANHYQCPQCKSDDTQRIAVLVDMGTSRGVLGGLGVNTNLDLGVGGGVMGSASELARKFAKPKEPSRDLTSYEIISAVLIVGGLFIGSAGLGPLLDGDPKGVLIGLPIMGLGGFLLWYSIQRLASPSPETLAQRAAAKAAYQQQLAQWNRAFLCKRCGWSFLGPEPPIQAQVAPTPPAE